MSEPKSEFLRNFIARGYFHQCTDLEGLDSVALGGGLTGYIGFDATAESLHVGNLVQIMLLRRLQQAGHRPIVLMGGGTTKIGDPSGKDDSRKLLGPDDIARNIAGIQQTFARFLSFGNGPSDAIMTNNADWLDELAYIPFLRDYGRHFSVNRMLSYDSVRLRLEREQPLSFLEFNYMILQAYDFLELSRRQNCLLQMGGSDQWGNIVNGVELGRRVDNRGLFGLTTPLITTAGGAKMGKTAAGAVWLNPDKLSPYDYWQYWRDTADADVGRFSPICPWMKSRGWSSPGAGNQRCQNSPGDGSNGLGSWPGRGGCGSRDGPPDLWRGWGRQRSAAHRNRPRRPGARYCRHRPFPSRRSCREQERGPPADQGRRRAGERSGARQRCCHPD